MAKKSICIVGGGPSGLCALKYVLDHPTWSAVLFERADKLGGIWRFTPQKGSSAKIGDASFPTPAYQSLMMNTPKQCCVYIDYPWPEEAPSFPTRKEVLNYFEDYADEYNLLKFIKFKHEVTYVCPENPKDRTGTKWLVVSKNYVTGTSTAYTFDHVLICTGREMTPRSPIIPNIEKFKGQVFTANEYVDPEIFTGKRVVIVGMASSGLDIVFDLAGVAKEVISSSRPTIFPVVYPAGVKEVATIQSATESGFVLADGVELSNIDCVIFCTGYDFKHDFLAPECGITYNTEQKIIRPLYRHIVCTKLPGLCFIHIGKNTPAFYTMSVQMKWLMKILEGTLQLPTEQEMNDDIEQHGILPAHDLEYAQYDYYEQLAKEGNFKLIPYIKEVMDAYYPRQFSDHANFRKDVYIIEENTLRVEYYNNESNINNNNNNNEILKL